MQEIPLPKTTYRTVPLSMIINKEEEYKVKEVQKYRKYGRVT